MRSFDCTWVAECVKDAEALRFLSDLFHVIEIWDDLIDGDVVEPGEIHEAFEGSLMLPANRFYQAHFLELNSRVQGMVIAWHTANALHSGSVEAKAQAYTLRKDFVSLVVLVVRLLHGYAAAVEASKVGWLDSSTDDSFEHFIGEA